MQQRAATHNRTAPKILCLGFNMYELFKEFYYLQLIVRMYLQCDSLSFFILTAVMFRYISLALNAFLDRLPVWRPRRTSFMFWVVMLNLFLNYESLYFPAHRHRQRMFLCQMFILQTGELCIFTGHEAGKLNTEKEKHFTIVVNDDWLLVGMKLSLPFEWKNEHLKHIPFPMVT